MQANEPNMCKGAQVALAAVIGGTAEALGGSKFANGAVTGAYVMMLNHLQQHVEEKNLAEKWNAFTKLDYNTLSVSERAEHILKAIKYSNQNGMDGIVPLYSIFDNLKNINTELV